MRPWPVLRRRRMLEPSQNRCSLPFWAGAALQSSIGKQMRGRGGEKPNSGLLNPSRVRILVLPKLSPSLGHRVASADGVGFTRPVALSPAQPLALSPCGHEDVARGAEPWAELGTDAWGAFHLMMKRELKSAFAFLKTQYWRRNSKYAVNRNS